MLSLLVFLVAPSTHAGIWLNAESIQAVDFDFVEARNKDLVAKGKPKQWMGIRLNLTWGDVQSTSNIFDFEALEKVLNDAQALNYKVILTISDKYWRYRISGKWEAYNGSAVPGYLDEGELFCTDFSLYTQGSCNSQYNTNAPFSGVANETFRIAQQHYISSKGWFARKYGAKRWNDIIIHAWLEELWPSLANHVYNDMTGDKIKDHPALYAIITPESSFPGISKLDQLNTLGYQGGEWYVDYLIEQASTLKKLFPNTPIISSINWIPPNRKPGTNNRYYQEDVATGLLKIDTNKTNIGWFTQDITNNFTNYELMVYPQMRRFPSKLRYGMITGESHKSSFTNVNKNKGLLNLAHSIGVRHLLFNSKGYSYGATGNRGIYDLIADADPGDYSFLESGSLPEITSVKIYERNPSRLVINFSEPMSDAGDLSAGFTIRIDGVQENIQSYRRHWNDKKRILLTLRNRIYSDNVVRINYAQNIGRIQDLEGDELADLSLTSQGGIIDNLTTTRSP